MPSIAETTVEMIQFVFPEHAGAPGQIHGGRMMQWIAQAGTMAAARLARGTVVLGAMDDIDFLHPVKVGDIAILRAQVEYVGRSSLEVGVRVWGESVVTGERTVTLNSHLVYVSVGEDAHPRPVGRAIAPQGATEVEIVETARRRREHRLARFARRAKPGPTSLGLPTNRSGLADPATTDPATITPATMFESVRTVLPEDALFGNMMFPGKMLMDIDEAGGILSMRYCKGFVMTACLDAMDFYSPIFTHEVVIFKAALNHVGTSSMEIGVKVLAERPWAGEVRHACTAFLTYVHLGAGGPAGDRGGWRPERVPSFTPRTAAERRRWDEATVRRELRLERVKRLRAALQNERG
jgi:acyl-CoA hydrolase